MNLSFVLLATLSSGVLCLPYIQEHSPRENSVWKGTAMNNVVEELRKHCLLEKSDSACLKYKLLSIIDQIFRSDNVQVSDTVEVVKNSAVKKEEARSEPGMLDHIEDYIQTHDVVMKLPLDASVKISARNMDQNELSFDVKLSEQTERSVGEARRSKLKKIIVPIMVFVLLKAITLVPLFIGALGLKAWNALQLSFFSFVISVALAVFQLCKKIASDSAAPQVSAHGPWESYSGWAAAAARNFEPHEAAYSAHVPKI